MNSPYKFGIIIAILITSFLPSAPVLAVNDLAIDIPLQELNGNQAIDLTGLISTQTIDIPIPTNWKITDESWLEIDITASELLNFADSAFTISLNGLQVKSLKIDNVVNTTQIIKLPANFFKQGRNTLAFSGKLYLPDDVATNCRNWDDPSRWLLIGPESKLHLSLENLPTSSNLTHFPEAFLQPLDRYLPDSKDQLLIVLPDEISQDDLNALSATSFFLGHEGGQDFIWNPQVLTQSEFNTLQSINNNIIFINNISFPIKTNLSTGKNAIAMFPSPWSEDKSVLILLDQDREDGYNPALVLGDRTKKVLLQGSIAYLDNSEQSSPPAFKNNYTFEDLGYLDRTVSGIGRENLIYRVYIPYNIEPTTAALTLQLAHSPDLDIRTSSFSIYLNGYTVASILPTAQSADREPIRVDLPRNRFRPGINFIRYSFDLHLPYSSCEKAPDSVWATIFNQTTLEMTHREATPVASLEHFPMPFNDYPGSTFVIPDQLNNQTLNKVARLAFSMGASSYYVNKPPEILTVTKYRSSRSTQINYIFIGSPSENPALRDVNDLLPQPFARDFKKLQEGFGVYLPSSDQDASTGLLQIIPSTRDEDGTFLILTGTDAQGIDWAWEVLLDPKMLDQFSGNLMVIGSAKKASSLTISDGLRPDPNFQQTPAVINIPIIGKYLQSYWQSGNFSALIAVFSAGILVLGGVRISSIARTYEIRKKNPPPTESESQD